MCASKVAIVVTAAAAVASETVAAPAKETYRNERMKIKWKKFKLHI